MKDAPQGTNILGILPGSGWGTADDRILVVGAHWDTVHESGGVDDNGGGVSALLELARQVSMGQRTYFLIFNFHLMVSILVSELSMMETVSTLTPSSS